MALDVVCWDSVELGWLSGFVESSTTAVLVKPGDVCRLPLRWSATGDEPAELDLPDVSLSLSPSILLLIDIVVPVNKQYT